MGETASTVFKERQRQGRFGLATLNTQSCLVSVSPNPTLRLHWNLDMVPMAHETNRRLPRLGEKRRVQDAVAKMRPP